MEKISIDAVDLSLLESMQNNASLSNLAVAEQLKMSPATCLRRVKRLRDAGLIEREIALLDTDRLGVLLGFGITALIEITLDRQGNEHLEAFEARVGEDDAVQQCYRVSPGPDFMLVVHVADMPGYLQLAQRLFTDDANVRNVKAFFSVKRSKFKPKVLLAQ